MLERSGISSGSDNCGGHPSACVEAGLEGEGDPSLSDKGVAGQEETVVLGVGGESGVKWFAGMGVNGSRNDDAGALLDLTGTIDDGASTNGIVKIGEGILRLAAGNTYSGSTTVRKGVISIPTSVL